MKKALTPSALRLTDAYWRASNYLAVGQIYLLDNPLLKTPLKLAHVKPRLLGHWGTTPGLNFIYVHLNRVIKQHDLDMLYVTGPGHGGPALVAQTYLEGSYTELYPDVTQDERGMKRLFKQFSFPGGIPSHVAAEVPGSIHEGGELGYALAHAYGAVFDNPGLIAACVIGDGEAETGPLAASWHSNKFLNPARDGAVLPILHLNGYKIANPAMLARIPPDELFDQQGFLKPELAALAPTGERRIGANPHTNGGLLLRNLRLPDFGDYAVAVSRPGAVEAEATRVVGLLSSDYAMGRVYGGLDKLAGQAFKSKSRVTTHAHPGKPFREITKAARELDPTS